MIELGERPDGGGWRPSAGFLLRGAALSAAIGLLIGLLIDAGSGEIELESLGWSALIGLLIFLFSSLFIALFDRRLDGMRPPVKAAVLCLLFGLAGFLGWLVVFVVAAVASGEPIRVPLADVAFSLGIAGMLAVVIGFAFYGYQRLRLELESKVSQLKEAEFATRELELARDLQLRLQPPPELEGPGFRLAAGNLAARWVAGDFFDVFRLADGTLGLAVGDVAGKGLGASLIMASVKARLPLLAAGRSPAEALGELNRVLLEELDRREFVALCCARFDPAGGEVTFASAGLPEPYLIRPGRPPRALATGGDHLPLGVRGEARYLEARIVLEPGDRLLLFTDGLAEARTGGDEPLGYEALAALCPTDPLPPVPWLESLFERIAERTRAEREDDWTALLLERLPVAG